MPVRACPSLSHVHCWWSLLSISALGSCGVKEQNNLSRTSPCLAYWLACWLAGKERHRRNGESCQVGT